MVGISPVTILIRRIVIKISNAAEHKTCYEDILIKRKDYINLHYTEAECHESAVSHGIYGNVSMDQVHET